MSTTEARDAAIREAKQYVRDIVRNDWVFELSPEYGIPSFSSPPTPEQDVLEWRLREYDSSGSELEPQPSPTINPADVKQLPGFTPSEISSPIATPLGDDSERRRKRRRQMEEEMRWNEGLRAWVERRDAWSGAHTKDEIRAKNLKKHQRQQEEGHATESSLSSSDAAVQSPPRSPTSDLVARTEAALTLGEPKNLAQLDGEEAEPSTVADDKKEPTASTETIITEPGPQKETSSATTETSSSEQPQAQQPLRTLEEPFIPVVPSLISGTNPIRASITPAMYPSIYSKVVIQGLTPTVPINLADVTKAMVQGWKADGQWPPKPTQTSIVLQDDATIPRRPEDSTTTAAAAAGGDRAPSSPESKRRSGVASAVRKVFHFSGFHPHPFHRRGSSSQQNTESQTQAGGESGANIAQ
ncbi:hypothetical protein ASPACDRAFT_77707 [Aspergillus aculeatus ATCC 16872]|uniref:Gag1-like clamp domain-containing protein n=1 Tax=Aspergillus aculeatus (strain ATCC 16872 / CBS 172.66 / WB 5094) TaxID=690307 RepID=A0A1L9WXL2_ASPA1|nr:uncharacterized protein ASPACDRAFT_77707 [Aspergillus aculeatus ATCC 16872]OJK00806.1 hypothetical protein ASPACDRAFT_77707 [Aspergillus aculeatus ATCC 16872]